MRAFVVHRLGFLVYLTISGLSWGAENEKSVSSSREDSQSTNTCTIRIHPKFKPTRFTMGQSENGSTCIYIHWDRKTTQTQTIGLVQEMPALKAGAIEKIDMNFDGYRDIKSPGTCGATGNARYDIWLYNPKTGLFEFSEDLSQLINPEPNPETKEIRTSSVGGHSGRIYDKERWKFLDGKLTLTRIESQRPVSMSDTKRYVWTVQERRNGKLVEVSRRMIVRK